MNYKNQRRPRMEGRKSILAVSPSLYSQRPSLCNSPLSYKIA